MSDEEFVRAHWGDPTKNLANFNRNLYPAFMDDWAAAAEFTREQLEQIRQLEAEISELDLSRQELIIWRKQIEEVGTPEFAGELAARSVRISRTVARLESALADLKRGMR